MISGTGPTAVDARILSLGDSYTIGEGVTPAEAWPVQLADLARALGVSVPPPTVIARTGWTTDELASAVDIADPASSYDIVTLLIGVNDQFRGHGVGRYREKFRALLGRAVGFAGGRAGRVVVLSIPDWGVTPFAEGRDRDHISREIDSFNNANREEAARAGARYVDVTSASRRMSGDRELVASDGLHPSARMYAAWAQLVLPELLAALTQGGVQGAVRTTS